MALFTLANWPLLFVCAAMVVAAVIDGWKLKVPSWLTLPLIISGWGLGLLHNCGLLEGTGIGGIGAALAGTFLGFALLLPVYAIGGMGAGDVKMQMGFGSWAGAYFGLTFATSAKVEVLHPRRSKTRVTSTDHRGPREDGRILTRNGIPRERHLDETQNNRPDDRGGCVRPGGQLHDQSRHRRAQQHASRR